MSKVAFNYFYLANKLPHNVVLKAGYISIPVGSYKKVLEADLEHPDVADAVTRGWIEVHSQEPDTSELPQAPKVVYEHDQYRGMTAEELKASDDKAPASTASSESIGRTTGAEVEKAEGSVTQIGQSAEEANTGAKRGRKAAAAE